MKKKWEGNRKKSFCSEMWGDAVRVRVSVEEGKDGGWGACENLVGLSMCDDPIETVKYIWVNTSCMLDWILSQKW